MQRPQQDFGAQGSVLKQVGHHAIDRIQALHIFLVRPGLRSD